MDFCSFTGKFHNPILKLEDGRWNTEDGRWKTEDGRRKTEDGRWKMEDGRRKMEDGRWKTEDGRRKMEVLSATFHYPANNCRLLQIPNS